MMEQWQIDFAERLARIEANQEFMKANIKDLPQSAQCAKDIAELKAEVEDLKTFKTAIREKIAYIGGVIVMLGLAVPYALDWVFSHLHWRAPS